jgi:hypothetical protein
LFKPKFEKGSGTIPHFVINENLESILSNMDPTLDKAIELIRKAKHNN